MDIEEEYGYNSEEESIFQSFVQDTEKNLVRKVSKPQSTKKESQRVKKEVQDILRRLKSNSYEFLIKF